MINPDIKKLPAEMLVAKYHSAGSLTNKEFVRTLIFLLVQFSFLLVLLVLFSFLLV